MDRTSATQTSNCASGAYGAASTTVACKNVEAYLDGQSSKTSTYTDKMWQSGVDGPWKLTAFDSLGNATFQPNSHYNGPQKGPSEVVKEVAYTSTTAEENDLQAGKIDFGLSSIRRFSHLTGRQKSLVRGPNWVNSRVRRTTHHGSEWDFQLRTVILQLRGCRSRLQSRALSARRCNGCRPDGIITNVDKGYGFPIYSPLPPNTTVHRLWCRARTRTPSVSAPPRHC